VFPLQTLCNFFHQSTIKRKGVGASELNMQILKINKIGASSFNTARIFLCILFNIYWFAKPSVIHRVCQWLQGLSFKLQRQDTSLVDANRFILQTIEVLSAMKDRGGTENTAQSGCSHQSPMQSLTISPSVSPTVTC